MGLRGAIAHWKQIAQAERDLHLVTGGRFGRLDYAEVCERTARALQMEIETGKPHCSCCLSPDNWHN